MGTPDLSDEEYRSLARFRHALRGFLVVSEQASANVGITPQQHQLLLAIRGMTPAGEPSIRELADLLHLRHHSTVELVQRARAAGLVAVRTDPDDGRRQLVRLTDDGADRLRSLYLDHGAELREYRSSMREILRDLER